MPERMNARGDKCGRGMNVRGDKCGTDMPVGEKSKEERRVLEWERKRGFAVITIIRWC